MKNILMILLMGVSALTVAQSTVKGSGGPDNFGYRWIDSDQSGGPVYSWVEISSVGQVLSLSDDSAVGDLELGFNLSYYDSIYNTVNVSSNGFLTFTSWDNANNTAIPTSGTPNDMIAAFWDDLNPGSQGAVYSYQDTANDRFIVQYDNVPKYGSSDGNTFQVIINSDNSIIVQYKTMNGVLTESTVGIENYSGVDGLQVAFNQAYIHNSLAVRFYPAEIIVGGDIALSVSSLDYGHLALGSTLTKSFTITNQSLDEVLDGSIVTIAGYTVSKAAKNTLEFRINPTKSVTYDLQFAPLLDQDYNGYIIINSTDALSTPDSIYVTGSGSSPDISISVTDTLYASTAPGGSSSELFNIINSGFAKLEYVTKVVEVVKSGTKGSGSPDSFGYTWKDSDEAGGPIYNWVEISEKGTFLPLSDDQLSSLLTLGFNFKFYGNTFSSVKVCSNGFLSFTTTATAYTNSALPATAEPNNTLAVFWDDLIPDATGKIYYYSDTVLNRFIVQFNNVLKLNSDRSTYQVILYSDGSVVYQYKDMKGALNACTVGIENSTGTIASQVIYNATALSTLKNSHAIEFYPPADSWLTVSPSKGTVESDSLKQITAGFDASELSSGVYYANLYIYSTDPDTPTINLPVKFDVYQLTAPQNVVTSVSSGTLTLNWSAVPHANSYKIYSSTTPYGTFAEDTTGTFAGSSWSTSIVNAKKFYKVTAFDSK